VTASLQSTVYSSQKSDHEKAGLSILIRIGEARSCVGTFSVTC